VIGLPNLVPREEADVRFELDPVAWVAAEALARERGQELIGIWHSHPDGPPRPSVADARGAVGMAAGSLHLLVDLTSLGSPAAITAWAWNGKQFSALD
jgi:proteasome lid subunit RPN8/RPN11